MATIYLSQFGDSPQAVGEYDATTGTAINASLITGLSGPWDFAIPASTAPVPEPSTLSMMAVAGVALLGVMRRRKCRTSEPTFFRIGK
jgi:hypothetical protein